ncbi:MAG TPA: DeoR family transcriptional regulator [Anaerolineales bacterium]|nr:DeoR family transcriptional regulator [Anaerolineales bacterium]HND49938.1 DeoR family transcriptional regulator [Anaerolineales bacterium]HNE06124.1 DeoR family transcriptional regulator [Anaerolineales bacterium]HNO94669.1 DeoR family transcriptional regulator [Anaerolineales bacterium]
MATNSLDREQKILEHLKTHKTASIQELAEAFGVSNMTIHRDLHKLANAGQIIKKHGGAALPNSGVKALEEPSSCAMCGKPASQRTIFIVKFDNGEELRACCAHCGLMMQSREKNVWQSLTVDFLYGHMISAGQAYYLVGSELNICCVPSILAFGSKADAEKFQKGFGGQLLDMENTIHHMHGMMHMHSDM